MRGIYWLGLFIIAVLTSTPGCNSKGPPPPEGQLAIEDVAKWFQLYREFNRGKSPPNEKAFVDYIEKTLKERGQTGADVQKLLTSPRDGQKYVIPYGKPTSNRPERNVAAYEAEGYDGKKLIAFESAWSQEVDDAELQKMLAASGK